MLCVQSCLLFMCMPKNYSSYHLHLFTLDGDSCQWLPAPLEVHHQLLGLNNVELQVVLITPSDEALCQTSVLLVIVLTDIDHDGGVIRELLEVI